MRQTLFLIYICFCFCTNLFSQRTAVEYTPGQFVISHEAQYNGTPYAGKGIPKLNKEFNIACYIFIDSASQQYQITEPEIINAIDLLNNNFKPLGFTFKVCEFNYIPNFLYNVYRYKSYGLEPFVLYRKKNTINLYLAASVNGVSFTAENYGFASTPSDIHSFIYLNKNYLKSTQALTHLMGHFFGLYDTDEIAFGTEVVDDPNCRTTGDLMCDTNADLKVITETRTPFPDLFKHYTSPNNGCLLISPFKDSNGKHYIPPTSNFMSEYFHNGSTTETSDCRCTFTPGQFRKMYLEVTNPTNTKLQELW
ncbi:MAG: hypothetical protein ACJAUV_001771 [Flavobacteriales bacterium]|jgi:hypothetical protein